MQKATAEKIVMFKFSSDELKRLRRLAGLEQKELADGINKNLPQDIKPCTIFNVNKWEQRGVKFYPQMANAFLQAVGATLL